MIASPTREELSRFLQQCRTQRVRSMREFAEQEIVIPDGPYAGRRFRCDRQPYTALWLDALSSNRWTGHVATGPTQSGKTLACFLIPLLYHLFEIGETVICGLPDMDMAVDKWREDILPIIEASRYRDLMPRKGGGSRGGKVEAVQFLNGATLKFMSGGGGDKSRAGFTSRVVVITETDGMDQPGSTSRESDKITQLEARTRAYGSRKRIYLECTVSTQEGRTWQEYTSGTASRIVLPCPHCREWVLPEREHLQGWKQAESQVTARNSSAFYCPACGVAWTEQQRTTANQQSRLVHDGETMQDGAIQGTARPTETLGFRWSAVHNLFLTAGDLGADEWRASRSPDEDNAEREMRQFVWCLPVLPSRFEETALQAEEITRRLTQWPRGIIPRGTIHLTAAIDIGKYLCHWVAVAWGESARGHVVDYGRIEVASQDLGTEKAIAVALREFSEMVQAGWKLGGTEGTDREGLTGSPTQVFIDAGYLPDVVYAFCRERGERFYPSIGRGAAQQRTTSYHRPTAIGNVVRRIGEGWHLSLVRPHMVKLVEINADQWKTWVHQRLTTPLAESGAMSLFQLPFHEHLSFAKHLTAERKTDEFVPGKGVVTRWEQVRKQNHWLDALTYASCAGHVAGARLLPDNRQTVQKTYGKLSDLQRAKMREYGIESAWGS